VRIETLTRMSGQIATNCSGLTDEQAVRRISDHLRAFWTPGMIAELAEFDGEHAGELDPRVSTALSQLVV
jgi:formate dehydrogenase subunit delta